MPTAIQSIPLETMTGQEATLGDYAGNVLLVVNVASKCGLTPQYEGLEQLYRDFRDRGLVVLGFPANDFLGQEPGTNEEIASFCSSTYDVDFPLFSKIAVTGEEKHPLYGALIAAQPTAAGDPGAFRKSLVGYGITPTPEPEVLWNFEKFLVSRDGKVVGRFAPTVVPSDPALVGAIEEALQA